jgi:L-rhamnose mutarotase
MGNLNRQEMLVSNNRLCFALDLKNDSALIETYRRYHAVGGPPAAVTRALRASGIETLEIYLCGNRLFMVMEVAEGFSPQAKAQADANDPDVQHWEELMWQFQQPLPWAEPGQKWVPAQKIYDLGEQPG